jgi:Polysaccharide lyase 14
MTRLLCALVLLGVLLTPALAGEALPQGQGLAAKYAGDDGIRKDPAVVFADGFECYEPTWEGEWPPSWDGVIPPRTADPAHVHRGARALELKVQPVKGAPATYAVLDSRDQPHQVPSADRSASVYTWYDAGTYQGSTGYDAMFARWYVMFAPGFSPGPLDRAAGALVGARTHWWIVEFSAKTKSDGENLYVAAAVPVRSAGGASAAEQLIMSTLGPDTEPASRDTYLGTQFLPQTQFAPQPGRWYCLEIMLKPNTPGKADGEQALWVDGKLIGHWTGLHLRDTENLKINGFWLQLAVAEDSPPTVMWCDDVVVAKSYIGPMAQ